MSTCCIYSSRGQLRVIYSKNDYWPYEGRIPYNTPWRLRHIWGDPPLELKEKELKSAIRISGWVRKSCYWIGTKLLGMKESYEEYCSDPGDQSETVSYDEKLHLIGLWWFKFGFIAPWLDTPSSNTDAYMTEAVINTKAINTFKPKLLLGNDPFPVHTSCSVSFCMLFLLPSLCWPCCA